MKTEIEILIEKIGYHWPSGMEVLEKEIFSETKQGIFLQDVLLAMQEAAKQEAIAFHNWVNLSGSNLHLTTPALYDNFKNKE